MLGKQAAGKHSGGITPPQCFFRAWGGRWFAGRMGGRGLRKSRRASELGTGGGWIFVLIVFFLAVLAVGWRVFSQAAPTIQLQGQVKGIGQSTLVAFEVTDARHRIKRVEVVVRQGDRAFSVMSSSLPTPAWWRFWSRAGRHKADFNLRVGHKEISELREGRASLLITATNDSWGRFFRGGLSEVSLNLPVRLVPPAVDVLTAQHYINQGGCDMLLFKVSPGTVESGVQVGQYFFPSWPVKESMPETRLCVFAYPYDVDPSTPARIVARDDAGNQTLASFNYRVFPKTFKTDTITISDDFIARVVPPILSRTPELQDQGSPLKNFLLVNGPLRQMDAQQLVVFSRRTSPHFLWTRPFVQLSNSQVEAAFADHRTYVYDGQVVDHQDHLGFDLAVVQHYPIVAANDGVVVHAGYFGIYGNAVVIDHGCGLQSLYGHMSSIDVKAGEAVKRGQVIGHSGQTGLAGGDHLHFTVLLDGIPVNPMEWWDPHWIHDRIEAKLQRYR
jgi:murein DD-endopeptidase MepM/ murein hydrolase activator NlpD